MSVFDQTPKDGKGSLFSTGTPSKEGSNTGAFTFGAATTSTDASKPSFTFGAANTNTNTNAGGSSTFSFGSNDKPFSFGSTTTTQPAATGTAAPSSGFSFGASSSTTNKPASTFTFGAPAEKKDDKPAAAPLNFSLNTSGATPSFGAAKTDEKKADKPSFTFGGAAATTTTTTEKKDDKPAGGFSFGATPATKDDKPAGGFSFGATPATKDDKPAGGFSFGAPKADEKKDDKPATSFAFGAKKDEPAKPATGGFAFGAKPDEKKDDKPAAPSGGFTLGAKADEKKDEKKTVSFTNSVIDRDEKKEAAKSVAPAPVSLNNKTLEDLITKWTNQLTKSSASFQAYSDKINEWDRVLVDGGDKISQLYTDVVSAEQTQNKVEQQLQYVERQQSELETFLDNYETKADALLTDVLSSNTTQRDSSVITNDQKREQAYRTAEMLDENLNTLGLNLSSLINEINDVSDSFNRANGLSGAKDGSEEEDNTLYQIVKLLNTHLDALGRIQKNSDDVQGKLEQFKNVGL